MDILAHGLWGMVAAKTVNLKKARPIKVYWAMFWGFFPDLFAFSLPFLVFLYQVLTGNASVQTIRPPRDVEAGNVRTFPLLSLAMTLYQYSHSLIIFAAAFGLVWLILRRPVFELMGWLLHILMDIPTHSYKFFPTPFLWPISNYKFNGIPWGTWQFEAVNYSLLLLAFLILYFLKRRKIEI